ECDKLRFTLEELESRKMEIKRLEYLNQCLDTLMQYVHDHVVSGAESSPATIAQLGEIKHEPSISKSYQHAQEICAQFTKVEKRPERPKNAYPTDHGDKGRLERPKSAYPVQRYSLEEMQTKIYDQQSTIDRLTTLKSQKKEECVRHCKEMDVLKGDLKHYENAITSLKEENIKNEKTILRLKDDNNELLNRLSKIASDRLTYENTDVTDLSDETRPSKLSEQMSELYDNQWTSAFEELKTNGFEDKIAIDILLNIVTETNEVCKAMAFSHYQKIEEACTFFESSPADMAIKEKIKIFKTGKISIEMKQDVKRIWRESSKKVLKKVIPIIEGKVANKFDILLLQMSQTPLYMKGCAELCWMMNIQEKPMHLDTSVLDKDGHKYFDTEKFRSYTKTGQYVAYVVWPALYLFEGGSLLKKGVAQGLKVETGANGQDHSRSVPRS
ncbi:hypothetical protein ACJMK2_031539, partial [Sinanodonta woodiana]